MNYTEIEKIDLCEKCFKKLENTNVYEIVEKLNKNFWLISISNYKNLMIRNLIHILKYKNKTSSINILNILITKRIKKNNINFKDWIIIPIPIHKRKERVRGFNQSKLIAKELQKIIIKNKGLDKSPIISTNNLIRTKNTKSQVKLENIEERRRNIKNSFKVINYETIKNKNIILVDDVFTTGSTMKEAVKILRKNGANKILGFVIAKT
ncbi:MAG: ComF family protein [Candidatus Paceibacterota bacterium]